MGKHSRRPPGEEPASQDPVAPPLGRGLRRDAEGRVVLDELAPEPPPQVDSEPGGVEETVDVDAGTTQFDETARDDAAVEDAPVDESSRRRHPARRAIDAARRGRRRPSRPLEEVGGPIQPTPTVYFGRPPGTENRRAGAASLVGAIALLAAAVLPWATRSPASLGATSFGWRDASGGLGPGVAMLLLGLAALGLAIGALAGSTSDALRVGDVVIGGAAVAIAAVELLRVRDAASTVADLTDDRATLSPSWGIAAAALGGIALLVAAIVHRSTPPAWRQA